VDDWVNFVGYRPNLSYSAGKDFSIECWFYLALSTYNIALASERSPRNGIFTGWVWSVQNISSNLVFGWWGGGGWTYLNSLPSQYIQSGRWNLADMVYETSSNTLKFYLNGIFIGTLSAGTIFSAADDLSLIRWDENRSGYSNPQQISKFSLYNRALSAAEITQNFNALRGRYGI